MEFENARPLFSSRLSVVVIPEKMKTQIKRSVKVGFFEVVTPLFTRGVVFARDSPLLLSLYGIKPHITGHGVPGKILTRPRMQMETTTCTWYLRVSRMVLRCGKIFYLGQNGVHK